jgi:hypothetical protein
MSVGTVLVLILVKFKLKQLTSDSHNNEALSYPMLTIFLKRFAFPFHILTAFVRVACRLRKIWRTSGMI